MEAVCGGGDWSIVELRMRQMRTSTLQLIVNEKQAVRSLKWAIQRRHVLHFFSILFGKEAALLLLILRAPDTSKSSPLRGSSPILHTTSNCSPEKREKGLFIVYFYTNFMSRTFNNGNVFRMQVVKYSTRTTTQEINTMMDNLNAFRQVKANLLQFVHPNDIEFSGS